MRVRVSGLAAARDSAPDAAVTDPALLDGRGRADAESTGLLRERGAEPNARSRSGGTNLTLRRKLGL